MFAPDPVKVQAEGLGAFQGLVVRKMASSILHVRSIDWYVPGL